MTLGPLVARVAPAGARRLVACARGVVLALALLLAPGVLRAQFPPEIRGRVIDRASGAPVAGARVEPVGGAERVVTGADGTFVLRGLDPGEGVLRVAALGFRASQVRVALANGRVTQLTVTLVAAPAVVALDAVRVTAAGAAPLPGATVLDRDRIARSQARELGELLQNEAGLVVTRRGGAGAAATLSVRGSGAGQVLVLLDGVPVNDALTNTADLSAVPLEAVERVTVLKGAESARYGAGALAGVVAVETRRPTTPDVSMRVGAGAYGERVAAASVSGRRALPDGGVRDGARDEARDLARDGARDRPGGGSLGGLAVAELASSQNGFTFPLPAFRGGGDDVRRNADARTVSLLASGVAERAGAELRLRGDLLDVDRGMPGFATQQSGTARQAQRRLGGALAARLARGGWEGSADLSVQEQRVRYRDPAPPFGTAYDDTARVTGVRAAVVGSATAARAGLTVGAELRSLRFRASQLAASAPGTQRLAGAWVDGRAWRAPRDVDAPRVELFGGARLDESSLLGAAVVSPRAGASFGTPRLGARLSWGRAFSPPSLVDQFFQEGVRARPNPDLRPERVRGEVELAGDLRAATLGPATLDASVAAYQADVQGMIIWAPNFRFEWRPENVDVRRRGVDATAQARFRPAAAELRAAVSRVAVEYATPALRGQVVYRPRTTASAGAAATLAGMRADVGARYVGARRTAPGSALNLLPAYTVTDLRVERPFTWAAWHGAVSLGIDDLLDHQPATLVDFPSPGRAWRLGVRASRSTAGRPPP